jgi:hypothetical protein
MIERLTITSTPTRDYATFFFILGLCPARVMCGVLHVTTDNSQEFWFVVLSPRRCTSQRPDLINGEIS